VYQLTTPSRLAASINAVFAADAGPPISSADKIAPRDAIAPHDANARFMTFSHGGDFCAGAAPYVRLMINGETP
jgi:hypothetical protein